MSANDSPLSEGCPMHLSTAVALCALAVLGGGAATAPSAQHPDLSGRWTFNAAQSDNPRDMLQGRDSAGDESRGGRGGGRYPGKGGGRGGVCGGGGVGRRRGGGGRGGLSGEERPRGDPAQAGAVGTPPPPTNRPDPS